jgi:hypothetical protein
MASEIHAIPAENFEPAGLPAGEMEDWFVLKGFDGFIAPGRLAGMPAQSAALVNSGRTPLAVLEIPSRNLRAASFDLVSADINMPAGEWRFSQVDPSLSAAVRIERGQCVLVIHPGPVEVLKRTLE